MEKALIEEHALIMLQKEEFWALKSRLNAATFGDRNTSYFHITTVVRRQRNKIRCLMDGNGEWIYDEDKVKDHIQSEFAKLYTFDLSVAYLLSPVSKFSCCKLSDVEKLRMGREVSDEDIKEALWSLKAFKAPGPDGLHDGFFQCFWHDVQGFVCQEVKRAFISGSIPAFLNTTLVTLIPKCNNPESLANFRLISLCNSVYKVISKVLVSRIRPLLNNLMSPVQAAFILSRRGVDNVIITQELLYMMDRMKGREGYIAFKVDLEKAYDRLEWSFVHNVLQAFHFPDNIIKLIMSCISTTSLSMLVNGSALDPLSPSRGIRQGDPISPYLFILCMEYLGFLIEKKCFNGSWCSLKASRGNIKISHLFFAYDLILFAKATNEIGDVISEELNDFCLESGQKISFTKSRIYFSPNTGADLRDQICEKLEMFETNSFGKYLGFPLRHKGILRRQFNFVANRVMKRLASWKTKFLSFASRAVLVKSVMSAIPNHVM